MLAYRRVDAWISVALLAMVFFVHAVSPVSQPYDSRWTIHTATSILHERNANLDEYVALLAHDGFYHTQCISAAGPVAVELKTPSDCPDGHFYHFYPLGPAILVAPVVGAMQGGITLAQPWLGEVADRYLPTEIHRRFLHGDLIAASRVAELLIASLLMAFATALFYLLLREWLGAPAAVAMALLFAFASPAWSIGSRALWMHSFSMLLLTAGLLLLRMGVHGRKSAWFAAGAVLAYSFYCRPTNLIPLVFVGAWILWTHRSHTWRYLAGALPILALFTVLNLSIYRAPLPSFSTPSGSGATSGHRLDVGSHVPAALAGHLVSPARGLFVYLPVVLFSLWGCWIWARQRHHRDWVLLLVAICAAHYAVISSFVGWYAGHSYGPRYFSDLTPLLLLPLVPVLAQPWRWRWAAPFLAAALFGLFVHSQGAWCGPCMEWSVKPADINLSTWRLWDWSDPMFLRGFQPEAAHRPVEPPQPAI